MEIIKITAIEQISSNSCYYELNGEFWTTCWNCGKPIKVDYHRTSSDLECEVSGEEMYFCDEQCCCDWISAQPDKLGSYVDSTVKYNTAKGEQEVNLYSIGELLELYEDDNITFEEYFCDELGIELLSWEEIDEKFGNSAFQIRPNYDYIRWRGVLNNDFQIRQI